MKCIILAAGYATRLYPLTKNFPKSLLKINEKTIIDWLIDDINSTNKISEFIIVSNHKFIDFFLAWLNKKEMNNIRIIDDGSMNNETRVGAVSDILFAIESLKINDDLLIIAGDNVLDFSFKKFIDYYELKKSSCIMRYYEDDLEKIKKSACVTIGNNDLVLDMVEKPDNPNSNWCVPPFYIYQKDDLKLISRAIEEGCKKDSPGSLVNWLYSKTKMYAMEMPGKRYDIGTIEGYEKIKKTYDGIK